MACRTAFLLSRPKTAGWLIHSKLASSSASRAETVLGSIPGDVPMDNASFERWRGIGPEEKVWCEVLVFADVGDGVRRRSGVAVEVGDEVSPTDDGALLGDFIWEVGGIGGRPPLPRPLRIDRVSVRRCCARSCWPRDTRVRARVSMSDVRSSIRRWTTRGWGGIGGVLGHADFFWFAVVAGSMVIARRDGRGR